MLWCEALWNVEGIRWFLLTGVLRQSVVLRQFWDRQCDPVHKRAKILRVWSRGVAQPGSAPALGEEPFLPTAPSGTLGFQCFQQLGETAFAQGANPKQVSTWGFGTVLRQRPGRATESAALASVAGRGGLGRVGACRVRRAARRRCWERGGSYGDDYRASTAVHGVRTYICTMCQTMYQRPPATNRRNCQIA